MADFRKLIYVFAFVALLTGLSMSANAQGMFCNSLTAVPQVVRAEGYTEYVGDIIVQCVATSPGVRTPVGNVLPFANVHVTIPGTTITSRHVTSKFTEALLLVDEPGKPGSIVQNQTYCGEGNNDSGLSSGECEIISPAYGNSTYDGAVGLQHPLANTGNNDFVSCALTTFGCGRPNIYQGVLDNPNTVTFPGVPMDPPGTNGIRTFRITNIRINATAFDPSALPSIIAQVTLEGTASVALQNTTVQVATVLKGLNGTVITPDTAFLQCTFPSESQTEAITITEGFRSAWKPRNVRQYMDNYSGGPTGNVQTWLTAAGNFIYDGSTITNTLTDQSQNIPDTHYFSESDFENLAYNGSGTLTNGAGGTVGNNGGGTYTSDSAHGIFAAGSADYGTRLTFSISAPPVGTTLTIPTVVYLNNGSITSGVMVMTAYSGTGTGVFTKVTGSNFAIPTAGATVVYEILFADPTNIETATINGTLSYTPILSDAAANVPTTASVASFAPYYSSVGTDVNGIPRFTQTTGAGGTFVEIGKCACNLLFPWVVSDSNYVTGIAVANTSKDPTNDPTLAVPGFTATQQGGKVTVYLFGTVAGNPATSLALPSSAVVPAGSYATFLVNSGFTGYAIANAQFQYCHGLAFLFNSGGAAPPVSYLGLVMDRGRPLRRTTQIQADGENN